MNPLKTPIFLLCFLASLSFNAQVFNPFYNGTVENVSADNILADLISFEDFGVKEPGTRAIENTKDWIVGRYEDLGYSDIEIQPFTIGGQTTSNIIVTKTGSVYPDTFLIIDGHYDTVNGPGTNDNGSGTVVILEMARLLKDIDTEYSIRFIHFSGEEAGLLGSKYYVRNTVIPENMDIKLVLNIDQVGGVAGRNNDTIVCERDVNPSPGSNNAASAAATQEMATCFGLYSNLQTEISYAYGSDYMPFESNGEVITGLYEKNVSSFPHTPYDTLDKMDPTYVYEVTKGALGSALHFAVGRETLDIPENIFKESIEVFPNPTTGKITVSLHSLSKKEVEIKVFNVLGKLIYSSNLDEKETVLDLGFLGSGMYYLVFTDGRSLVTRKLGVRG